MAHIIRRVCWTICWTVGFALAFSSCLAEEMILVSGASHSARLLTIDGDRIGYASKSGVVKTVTLDRVVRWGSLANPTELDQLLLVDGSLLRGRTTKITREAITVETDLWGELQLPRSKVVSVIWRLPPTAAEQWKTRDRAMGVSSQIDQESKGQMLWLANGDALSGRVLSGNRQLVRLVRRGEQAEVKLNLVTHWSLQTVDKDLYREARFDVGLRDGTRLLANSVRLDGSLQVELACGFALGTALGVRPVDERLIAYVRPRNRAVQYLSDVKPLGYKHIPFLSVDWPWQADRSVLGGPLSSRSLSPDFEESTKYYLKGIGMHSTSRLAFQLEREFDEFQAEVCLDATARNAGSVVFRVFAQENKKWKEFYKSPIQRAGQPRLPVRVPLKGSRQIALVVDYADRGDVMDRANWLGARVVNKSK